MNTKFQPNIICPYCGHEETDSWEWNKDHTYECGECGKKSDLTVDYTIEYSTSKIDDTK